MYNEIDIHGYHVAQDTSKPQNALDGVLKDAYLNNFSGICIFTPLYLNAGMVHLKDICLKHVSKEFTFVL